MAKPVDKRGNLESKSCSFYGDQMDFIEEECIRAGLNFPQYIRKLVDAETNLVAGIADLERTCLKRGYEL